MPEPRTRSRLPGFAAAALAQPATHETELIVAGAEAYAPPGPAEALAGATSPPPHANSTTLRFSSTSPPRI